MPLGTRIRKVVRLVPLVICAVLLLGPATPAHAATCFIDLQTCYYRAALIDDWGTRWLAGLDCEISFVECGRIAVIGR